MLRNQEISLRASSPIWASEASLARTRERGAGARVLARLVLLAQIGELARRLSRNRQGNHGEALSFSLPKQLWAHRMRAFLQIL